MPAPEPTVGLVLVSHSRPLAEATLNLLRQMAGGLAVACAAGAGEDGGELGTDPMAILGAYESLAQCKAIVVLLDIGSAVLSAELARDLAEADLRARIHLSPAPFVEGAIAASVAASAGLPALRVLAEAMEGLAAKRSTLGGAATEVDHLAPPDREAITRTVAIADRNGLHLRPAARAVATAARFTDATIVVRHGDRLARLDSLTALIGLGVRHGDELRIEATGREAAPAADALVALLGEAASPEPAHTPDGAMGAPVPLAPGRVCAPLIAVSRRPLELPPGRADDGSLSRLNAAIAIARTRLAGDPILIAQSALLSDPALLEPARAAIGRGVHEAAAWADAIEAVCARHECLPDPYLRARARDIGEAGDAVLQALLGTGGLAMPQARSVILVDDLTAAEAAALPANVVGVLDRRGGPNSHAAILLRAAGIPALGAVVLAPIPARVAFDGATGELIADPDEPNAQRFTAPAVEADRPSVLVLPDGSRLALWANVAGPADAAAAARAGAGGIGLARTEMLFLDRADPPGEAEQEARIAAMLAPFRGRPVMVRVLDAGADKPVPFLGIGREANPALGVRGIRALLRNRAFLAVHLRAILRAGDGHDLRITIPMVTAAEEMVETRAILTEAAASLGRDVPPLGAMIEVPAAALSIPSLVPVSDHFSIGTNDLVQYLLAAERGHPGLAAFASSTHPAVLELCARVVREAGGRPVSICGEAAGDPAAARSLVDAGVRCLSMGAARLREIRAAFSR